MFYKPIRRLALSNITLIWGRVWGRNDRFIRPSRLIPANVENYFYLQFVQDYQDLVLLYVWLVNSNLPNNAFSVEW